MKKIIIVIIFIAIVILGITVYLNYPNEEVEQLTDEKINTFSKIELENYCLEHGYDCNFELVHDEEINEGELVSYDLETYSFTYSKGNFPIETHTLSWGAVGDVIIYSFISFYDGNSYNYDSMFQGTINTKIQEYDIASYTQESIAAGCAMAYPNFCTPYEFISTMERTGFDVVNTANNHSLDQGHDGLERSLNNFENYNILPVGTYKQADYDALPKILEYEEFKIGLVSYAQNLNGYQMAVEYDHTVSLYSKDKMEQDVQYLKAQDVDFIISFVHWGPEYTSEPTEEQRIIAKEFANADVDIVLGSHSHTLNPIEIVKSEDDSTQTLVAYSLGNFQASQHSYIFETAYGGVLEFELIKKVQNNNVIEKGFENIKFYPTFNKPHTEGLVIIPLVESNYADQFDRICGVVTKYETSVECYN